MHLDLKVLNEILNNIPTLKIGMIGDGGIDVYWEADMTKSELSREVPHYPLPIVEERFSLGAGANVIANLASLGASNIKYVTCVGNDWRSNIFFELLKDNKVSREYIVCSDEIITPAYCKPKRNGISDVSYEDPRLDFANFEDISKNLECQLIENLKNICEDIDILIVSDQFKHGCITDKIVDCINELGKRITIVVDSRDRIHKYRNVIIKPNEVEACIDFDMKSCTSDYISVASNAAATLMEKTKAPVLITLGENGAIWCDFVQCMHVPAFPVQPPIDFVGAGDSFLASFALCYPLDIPSFFAPEFACLASCVTIQKIGTTGTASPTEMIEIFTNYLERKEIING